MDNPVVGLYYAKGMEGHIHPRKGLDHEENPERIISIWGMLQATSISERCVELDPVEAEDDELGLVHTDEHIRFIKSVTNKNPKTARYRMNVAKDVYFNSKSSKAARLAAGGAIKVACMVADEKLSSGFAIVRPPGHHAEKDNSMGFCLFNNIAIAARFLLSERAESIRKILIVDWDIHHGNGTQDIFYEDNRVLVFSVHRHGPGFFPQGDGGSHRMIGTGEGEGFNINVPWESSGRNDDDYFAVWEHLLLPVGRDFNPDIVLVSAGFDAAEGDPLGECHVTSEGFAMMLKKLMEFAGGKIVLVLEGGYNTDSLAICAQACVEVLTGVKEFNTLHGHPSHSTSEVINLVRKTLSPFWPVLAQDACEEGTSQRDSFMDPDPIKARRAALNIASRAISFADTSYSQIGDINDVSEQLAHGISRLQLLSRRLKDSKDTAQQPESSGR